MLSDIPILDEDDEELGMKDDEEEEAKNCSVDEGAGQGHGSPEMDVAWEIAGSAGLDLEKAETDQFFPGITGILNQDAADVEALAIRQTPTFFLNGKRLENFNADSLIADVRFAVENS